MALDDIHCTWRIACAECGRYHVASSVATKFICVKTVSDKVLRHSLA